MKTMRAVWMTAVLLAVAPASVADTEALLAKVAESHTSALAVVRSVIQDPTGTRTVLGPGVCIDPTGVLMTLSIDRRMRVQAIKKIDVILPGVEGKTLPATLMGIDPVTGLAFVRAEGEHAWSAVRFATPTNLSVGRQVVSVGLMTAQAGFTPYVGAAHVSTTIRTPARLVYVTGGKLSGPGSPVFDADGRAVGIVGSQAFVKHEMRGRRGTMNVDLKNSYETAFFLPTEEFSHALKDMPSTGRSRRVPWLGANKFQALTGEKAKALSVGAAVMIEDLIPGQPAAEAGLTEGDVIVALNGQPIERLATPMLTTQNFLRDVMRLSAGQQTSLTIVRDDKTYRKPVTLSAMPTLPSEARQYCHTRLGLWVREKVMLDRYLGNKPSAAADGMVVVGFVKGSPAAGTGMLPGDMVTEVQGCPVSTVDRIRQVLAEAIAEDPAAEIQVTVHRADEQKTYTLKMPPAPAKKN